jgi:antitoxin ParD1/3/4
MTKKPRSACGSPMEEIEQREAERLHFLRKAWQEGLDSGDAGELDFKTLKQEARARLSRP